MKFLVSFSFLLFACFGFAKSEKYCSLVSEEGNKFQYSFLILKPLCVDTGNCWLKFDPPEDLIKISVNQATILDFLNTKNYLSNESIFIPISSNITNEIIIEAKDLNRNQRHLENLCIQVGKHEELRWKNAFSWFFKTGSTLYSSYFLLVLSFFLIFSFWFRKSGLGFSLFVYSLVSSIYLLSFSEYPRAILDPVLSTGGFHFPLRLLQDLCLVYVFYNFYQKYDSWNVIKKLAWVYVGVIGIYLLLLLVGIKDYLYYSRIIILMAPLVAAPMAIGTWFAFKLKKSIERKVLLPVSVFLLILQLNDLLVFWGLIKSYFTVRLYIPFVVGMLLFLYFRRMHEEVLNTQTDNERQRIFKSFLHDVRSPLAILRIFMSGNQSTHEHKQIIESALDRIESMVSQVANPKSEAAHKKIGLVSALLDVIEQKKVELPKLIFDVENIEEVYTYANKTSLQRIFSNIINNAYEACVNELKIDIRFLVGDDKIHLLFCDKGKGIPRAVRDKIFKENITTKENGMGIGLISAYDYILSLGGSLNIISKEGFGTTVEIILYSVSENFDIEKAQLLEINNSVQSLLDFVLIDDDKYIRLSWEYFAKNTKKSIKTFPDIESFLKVANRINLDCPIYLDLNLNGVKSTNYIDKLVGLGFVNIILATGEDISDMILPEKITGVSSKLPPSQ